MATKTSKSSLAARTAGLSTNTYIALVTVITFVIVVVCAYVGWGLVKTLSINGRVIAGDAKAKSDLDTKLQNAPVLVQNYNNLGPKKQLIADAVPNTADFPQLVSIIESAANASGVTLKSVSPSTDLSALDVPGGAGTTSAPPATPSGAQPYTFKLSAEGPYVRMISLLQNLELSARPMRVTSIDFKGTQSDLSADITVQTYYQNQSSIDDKTESVK